MNAAPPRMNWLKPEKTETPRTEAEYAEKWAEMIAGEPHKACLPDTREPRGIEVHRASEAEERRRQIIAAMGKDRLTKHEIGERTGIPAQTVYDHMRILKRRKVVDNYKPTKSGAAVWYVRQGA